MSDIAWVQRDFWRLRPHAAWQLAWNSFRATVMHRHRFLFATIEADPTDPDDVSPLGRLHAAVVRFSTPGSFAFFLGERLCTARIRITQTKRLTVHDVSGLHRQTRRGRPTA